MSRNYWNCPAGMWFSAKSTHYTHNQNHLPPVNIAIPSIRATTSFNCPYHLSSNAAISDIPIPTPPHLLYQNWSLDDSSALQKVQRLELLLSPCLLTTAPDEEHLSCLHSSFWTRFSKNRSAVSKIDLSSWPIQLWTELQPSSRLFPSRLWPCLC